MGKTKVSIQKAAHYESESIHNALIKSFHLLGGLERIIQPKSRVFVKINHLSPPSPPEDVIITHPAFTKEVLRLLLDIGCEITVGDDIQSKNEDGFLISGYRKICTDLGVNLINLKECGFREIPCRGRLLTRAYLSPLVLDCDFLINLPKLKTHSFTSFTGAIKNMYGIIPHGFRCRLHREYPKSDIFAQMLVDIYACAIPNLNIMDGILAMEGEGPSAGSPKEIGIILASLDGVALDAVASTIIGLDPNHIPMIEDAGQRGLGKARMEDIEIVGERITNVQAKDFKPSAIAVGLVRYPIPAFLHGFVQSQLVLVPRVLSEKCAACRECEDICPTGAVQMRNGKAWIDKSLCIHCMCCHEVCRFHAVKLGQKFFGRLIRQISAVYKKLLSTLS
jgi:uncharacterized protein (DUF362 family)/Pyruvate/2-oxoacid:ferredoxin oxidoreductase delta subunit